VPESSNENKQLQLEDSLDCDMCGRFGAVEFGDRHLCPDCYESSGSCCPEFGREECDKAEDGGNP
jgi:hypothetical protein